MSIGAELLMRSIADTLQDAIFISEFGDGCPLLEAGAEPPIRMARRPAGGVIRRADLTTFAPPLDLARRKGDCSRLARKGRVLLDAVASEASELVALAADLAPEPPAALRIRGPGYAPPDLRLLYESRSGADRIYISRDLITDRLSQRANAFAEAGIDEFDALAKAIRAGGVIAALRHGAAHSEVLFDPASFLDQADPRQVASALGDGRAVMAHDGGCALFVPQLSGAPMPVTVTIGGLEAGAPSPTASLSNAPGWTVDAERLGRGLRFTARPGPMAPPLVSLFMEIEAPDSPNAEVTEIASAITRARGAWEIWDEAQQQLELEESW